MRSFTHMHTSQQHGFTLIEMLVSVALFAIVMLIMGGALLSLTYANRKAQALQSVMNNLNISLDSMVRGIRMGNNYRCGSATPSVADCATGGSALYITPYGSDSAQRSQDWGFIYDSATQRLYKVVGSGQQIALTAPEVKISSMTFYVVGTTRGDTTQPKVVITIKGSVTGSTLLSNSTFNIQATAVQRLLDL